MLIQKNKLHILIFCPAKIPAHHYGGTERILFDLGKALHQKGYKITYLVKSGSYCDFAEIIIYNPTINFNKQIPASVDFVHCHDIPNQTPEKPYLVTIHGNPGYGIQLDEQCIFISKNHAERYNSSSFVHNGLDWTNYPDPDLNEKKTHFHFLANASWKVKNVRGAIKITKMANEKLEVLGGNRLNFKMGWRLTLDTHVKFKGMVNNSQKASSLNNSKGLIFPVLWHEPFGLAVIESLYFGCPVFATPFGSLPEIVTKETGFLSASINDLSEAVKHAKDFDSQICKQHAITHFSSEVMAENYISYYQRVLNGEILNPHKPSLLEKPTNKYLSLD